jgi:predicted nucleotidyltransferase component of viral defense system
MSDGTLISIYSLTIEDFLIEKINTYLKRFKVKDLWDIFFLLKNSRISNKEIEKLIKNYKKPIDEDNLKVIIIEGIIPSSEEMFDYIKSKWENKYI